MDSRRSEKREARARRGMRGTPRCSVLHARQSVFGVRCSVFVTAHSPGTVTCIVKAVVLLLVGLATCEAQAAPPAPPSDVIVEDVPNDNGTAFKVTWTLSPDDTGVVQVPVLGYYIVVFGKDSHIEFDIGRLWKARLPIFKVTEHSHTVHDVPAGVSSFVVKDASPTGTYEILVGIRGPNSPDAIAISNIRARVNWFHSDRNWFAGVVVLVCGTVIVCTEIARRGKPFYVRPIAGLQAIEEAVGRATEMGRPMLFVPGIEDVKEIDTVAGLMILSHVAKTAAEYDTPLEVPTTRSLVMTAAREAVQAAALAAGRPDYYDEERIHYVTDEQFGYVAATCGWMYREKPAACFFLGKFFAESLILAESGNAVGAIQIAGTAETTQLPFFVAACDYTLLGEELFAASAYLSGEPAQLGMLKGQDFGKLAAIVLVVIGCGLATWDSFSPRGLDDSGKPMPSRMQWITDTVLKGGG
jgi:hypothetical protein